MPKKKPREILTGDQFLALCQRVKEEGKYISWFEHVGTSCYCIGPIHTLPAPVLAEPVPIHSVIASAKDGHCLPEEAHESNTKREALGRHDSLQPTRAAGKQLNLNL